MQRVNDKAVVFLPWDTIEPAAQQQILNTASMPFVFKHVAVMPDCHYGKGATVGTVVATSGAVIPAAVGVDIGCGMIAVRSRLKRADIPDARKVRAGIERRARGRHRGPPQQLGDDPGSMGTRSYIVVGKQNPMSFFSAPHGAGRRYSRTKARALFKMQDLSDAMEGIEYRHSGELLDEIPAAYKDIDQVMENAKDLVEVKHILKQFINIKGD